MKKALRILIVAALVFSILSLSFFIILNGHHDHEADHCRICLMIESAAELIRSTLSAAVLAFCFVRLLTAGVKRKVRNEGPLQFLVSPIELGVRLNN